MKHDGFRCARGTTLLEITCVMTILAGAFFGVLSSANFIASGMVAERVHADQSTRATGTLYDIVSELRDATIYSPNFYLEQDPSKPPRITFDKADTVDPFGKMIWGSKITYRLDPVSEFPNASTSQSHDSNRGIVAGRIVREELAAQPGSITMLSVIEEYVPYHYALNGILTWGFNVTLDGSALTLTISRFGDTHVESGDDSTVPNPSKDDSSTAASNGTLSVSTPNGTSESSKGTVTVFTVRGTYYLRNPQEVIPAQ